MAPPLQAIRIVHHLVLAASMLVMVVSSAELTEPPPPSTTAAASAPLHPSESKCTYTMQFRIGNTAVSGIADTGSDLIWTNNSQLFDDSPVSCPSDDGKEMGGMTSCHGLCTFEKEYGGVARVRGVMGEAKLTFGDDISSYTTPDLNIGSALIFGCHLSSVRDKNKMACNAYRRGGIVGLGRGKLSLVSQLRLHSFSYCLPRSASKETGQIKFNDTAAVSFEGTTKLETIEGLPYPASSRYYVGVKNIVVGTKPVSLPNGCFEDHHSSGDGGMVIDSGTAFTNLPKEAFDNVKVHVEKLLKDRMAGEELKEVPKDGFSCYEGKYPTRMDSIVLHFCREGRMEIPAENYLVQDGTSFCLAFKQRQDDGKMSILGAYQQQGMHMLFDIARNTLSFAKRCACGQSQEDNHATM